MRIIPSSRRRILIHAGPQSAEELESVRQPGLETTLRGGSGLAEDGSWLTVDLPGAQRLHPWDEAHGVVSDALAAGLESAVPVDYAEPDFVQEFPVQREQDSELESLAAGEPCRVRDVDPEWPPQNLNFGWHLTDAFSGLKSAREFVGTPSSRILVGILDTGYDPFHVTLPMHMRLDLARNFTGSGDPNDAVDPASQFPLTNPGHGTGTLALLAGRRVALPRFAFDDFLGGAPHVDIVPIRIADSVVQFQTSAMAQGIEYALQIGCQVVSISMGGIPSQAWAAAVNKAYEGGMLVVAAAGNHFGPLPPTTLVYPARFGRALAVCGFTANKEPYHKPGFHTQMHGCFGPSKAMETAVCGFSPNVPWAAMGCGGLVNPNGGGTSSATPQVAAAAALWLQQHAPNPAEKWRRVEAVRTALFTSADTNPAAGPAFFGNGLLRARQALDIPYGQSRTKAPVDEVSFPWFRLLGALESVSARGLPGRERMFETEALQIFLSTPRLQALVGDADPQLDTLDRKTLRTLVAEVRQHRGASQSLRDHLRDVSRSLTPTPSSSTRVELGAASSEQPPQKVVEALRRVVPVTERAAEAGLESVGGPAAQTPEVDAFFSQLRTWTTDHPQQVNTLLRQLQPILVSNNLAFVTRFDDVQEVFARDDVFFVTYGEKMQAITGGRNFFLGMQNSPDYLRDVSNMRVAVRRDDISSRIAPFVAQTAQQIVSTSGGRLDLVQGLARVVPTRLIGSYFGTPGRTENELADWATHMFQFLFVPQNSPEFDALALQSAAAARVWLDETIARRKGNRPQPDDVLERLFAMQDAGLPGLQDLDIRNNLLGLLIGAIPTTSTVTALAIDQLLNRPEHLQGAQAAARLNDDALLWKYILEALRFNPMGPAVLRICAEDYVLAKGSLRATLIPRGTVMMVGTQSAMFDDTEIDDPNEFRIDRPDYHYLHFGYGLHKCFGQYINQVQIPSIAQAVLQQRNLRRAAGSEGQIARTGPFPSSLTVEFDL